MAYVIGLPCVDVKDLACVEECPVEAFYYEDDLPDSMRLYTVENAQFFSDTLPGRTKPLGSPGGAARLGPLASDTPTVAALLPQTS